ncbi:MAG: insulinase family protein [Firmicutes bacterium]|nr:insulinase family protein [Bacillota bacterium]
MMNPEIGMNRARARLLKPVQLKLLIWLLSLLALFLFTAASQALSLNYDTKILKNGIKVFYKVLPQTNSVTARIIVPAGSLNEPHQFQGISHLIEHLIYRGNETHTTGEFQRTVADQGGNYNGFNFMDRTEYYLRIPAAGFAPAFSLYLNLITQPAFAEPGITLEKKIITIEKELRNAPGNVGRLFLDELTQTRLNSSIEAITRDDLYSYHQKFYTPQNLAVIITGAFNPDQVFQTLSELQNISASQGAVLPERLFPEITTNKVIEDDLAGEYYQVLLGFELKKLAGKDLLVAKALPLLARLHPLGYDYLYDKPLNYDISLLNAGGRYYLIFCYTDYQNDYTLEMNTWHDQNIIRYCKYLQAKNFSRSLQSLAKSLETYYKIYALDPDYLNQFYEQILFDPTVIASSELSAFRNLKKADFKNFVSKYLENKSCQKVIVKAK